MKANELMIGDWVLSDDKPYKYYAPYLNLNNDLSDGCWIVDSNRQRYFTGLTDIKPIPLTAEILEKNGFVYNDIPFVQGWEQFGLLLYEGGEGYRINCGTNIALIINSVHELQHALRLCGIDKTIEI